MGQGRRGVHAITPVEPKRRPAPALAPTQLKVYQLLADPGMGYEDLGRDYYERQRDVRRQVAHHVGKLGAFGFEVTLCRIPEPHPDGTGPSQAA